MAIKFNHAAKFLNFGRYKLDSYPSDAFEAKNIYGEIVTVVRIVGNVAFLGNGSTAHVTKLFVDGQPLGPRE